MLHTRLIAALSLGALPFVGNAQGTRDAQRIVLPHTIFYPVAAANDSQTVVVGNTSHSALVAGERSLFRGVLIDRRGTVTLPPPPGGRYYVNPRVTAAPDGAFHVIWGEPDLTREPLADSNMVKSIWHAVLRAGRWSAARRITSANWLLWNRVSPSRFLWHRGELVVAVSGSDTDGRGFSVLLRLARGQWATTRIHDADQPAYIDIAMRDPDRMVVAFIGTDSTQVTDRNSVFVMELAPDLSVHSQPRLIHRSPGTFALDVRVRTVRDSVHVNWVIREERAPHSRAIGTAVSATSDRWQVLERLATPAPFTRFELTPDACGDGAVAVEASDGKGRPSVWYGLLRGNRWIRPLQPVDGRPSEVSAGSAPFEVSPGRFGIVRTTWRLSPEGVPSAEQTTVERLPASGGRCGP